MKIIEQYGEGALFLGAGSALLLVHLDNADTPINMLQCPEVGSDERVVAIAVSADKTKVFAAYSNKYICCWDTSSFALCGSIMLKKRPTAIAHSTFSSSGATRECIFVSDKAGDIFAVDVALKKSVLVGGHTASVITDLAIHGNILATADRDEKIRISRIPNVETIAAYCLGHVNVVCSIGLLEVPVAETNTAAGNCNGSTLNSSGSSSINNDTCSRTAIVSCGWDHQLCLWDTSKGTLLGVHSFPQSAAAIAASAAADHAAASAAAPAGFQETDELAEKVYSEAVAGNFPFKVCVSRSMPIPVVGVIYKGLKRVSLFMVSKQTVPTLVSTSSSSSNSANKIVGTNGMDAATELQQPQQLHQLDYSFTEALSIELEDVPVDAFITSANKLVLILPAPHFLRVYALNYDNTATYSTAISSSSSSSLSCVLDCSAATASAIDKCRTVCSALNVKFSQQLMSSALQEGGDQEEEMKKHVLDAPFAKEIHFGKGQKRAGFLFKKGEKRAMMEKEKAEKAEHALAAVAALVVDHANNANAPASENV